MRGLGLLCGLLTTHGTPSAALRRASAPQPQGLLDLVLPNASASFPEGVTLMINCIEGDFDKLELKVPHLVSACHYNFTQRILVMDTNGSAPSERLMSAFRKLKFLGVLDAYMVVDYSPAYRSKAKESLAWQTDHSRHGLQGNLVYYQMLDRCSTRYIVHFDLDIVMFSVPEYSWVEEAVHALKENPDAFYVKSPRAGAQGVGYTDKLGCKRGRHDFVAMRNFLMDRFRCTTLLNLLSPEAMSVKPPVLQHVRRFCGRDWTLESMLSCSICQLRQYGVLAFKRLDLLGGQKNWALHFPELFDCGPSTAAWVLSNLVEGNRPVPRPPGFQAASVRSWLQNAMQDEQLNVPQCQ